MYKRCKPYKYVLGRQILYPLNTIIHINCCHYCLRVKTKNITGDLFTFMDQNIYVAAVHRQVGLDLLFSYMWLTITWTLIKRMRENHSINATTQIAQWANLPLGPSRPALPYIQTPTVLIGGLKTPAGIGIYIDLIPNGCIEKLKLVKWLKIIGLSICLIWLMNN